MPHPAARRLGAVCGAGCGLFHPSRVLRCSAAGGGGKSVPLPTLPFLGEGLATLNLINLWFCKSPQFEGDRFYKGDFSVFDTKQRHDIRAKLWELAESDLRKSQSALQKTLDISDVHAQAYVTGVGGNGKSHNLALFVQQARDAGAVVLYIHDMQLWLNAPQIFFKELRFAVAQWNQRHLDKDPLAVPSLVKQILNLPISESRKATNDDAVGEATRLLCARCTAVGVPFLVVIDQDNRLNKLTTEDKEMFTRYNRMVLAMQPHLLVLGASANNEGWDRRSWPNRIEHLPEPVPAPCIAALFPRTQGDQGDAGGRV
jgi:hypothetical protein